jgi:tripartite-type tricarboxylate transporter receptor subunit TctC
MALTKTKALAMRKLPWLVAAILIVSVVAPLPPSSVRAQAYPSKSVTFVIPFGAGGSADTLGRIVAAQLSTALKQTFIVENRAGGSANIGMSYVAKAAPDGYTILFANNNLVTNKLLMKTVPVDVSNFEPVALLAIVPNVLAVPASSPAKSLKEFIELAKANSGKFNYGSTGIGTSVHLASELFKSVTGTDIVHVPYTSSAQGMVDLVAGRLQMELETAPDVIPRVRSGDLRALAIASPERSAELPDVPTFRELGYPELVTGAWVGLVVPSGTPTEVVNKLSSAMRQQAETDEYKNRMHQLGAQILGGTPAYFANFLNEQKERWGRIISSAGIKIE